MKFSWLTVEEKSMAKEHKCVVKHEFNKGGGDQEIFFPPIKKDKSDGYSLNNNQEEENDELQIQFTNTSAYYTYLLLIIKSTVYFAVITFCLLRRTEVCGNERSS